MTVVHPSRFIINRLVLAGMLATAGIGAIAQTATNPQGDAGTSAATPAATPRGERMGRYDPAKLQAQMKVHGAKRQADIKAKLKITPAQEGAWTAFTASMQPPAGMGARPMADSRAELDKLTTPERIDKLRALRTQRMTEMAVALDKRGEATKTFYAALSPEQQKVFDAEHKMRDGRHGGGHHGGMHDGKG